MPPPNDDFKRSIHGTMRALLKQKVAVSKSVWLSVSAVAFTLLSRTIIIHKADDIVRIHDMWLWPFQAESYQGATALDLAALFSLIIFVTEVILILAALVGWVAAAVLGCLKTIIKVHEEGNRTTESNATSV